MAFSETLFAPAMAPLEVAVLVLPQASILEVASVLDPMRSANRHAGAPRYRWRVVSPTGGPVGLTCGIDLPAGGALEAALGAQLLVVIAGFDQRRGAPPRLISDLRRLAPRFQTIAGVDAGAWVLARAGLLNGHRATVHWEDLEDFARAHPGVDVVPDRYVISGNRITVGGAGPAADLMLHLIARRDGAALAAQVAGSFLYEMGTPGTQPQRPGRLPAARDARVSAALTMMAAHLEEPLPLQRIARAQGLGERRLSQLFRADLGQGPAAAYLELRLQAARRMLTDTGHPVGDIALRCGFSDQTVFSRAFRRRFGVPARALRRSDPAQRDQPDRRQRE
jgi:transcriptional regulator GlxA family with amidase domain